MPNASLTPSRAELGDLNGALLAANDTSKGDQQTEIEATGLPSSNDLESAIFRTLAPAADTAILRGKTGGGIALVEIYNIR